MGCCGGKTTVEDYYATEEIEKASDSGSGGSARSSTGSVDSKASQRVTAGSKKRTQSQAGASERTSIAAPLGDNHPGVTDSEEKSSRAKTRRESENPANRRESANRRTSEAESQHSLQANCEAAAPFTIVEVSWKVRGVRCTEVDWIGMYKGEDQPADINDAVSTMMGTGKAQGTVNFMMPNNPGLHHFRYFDSGDALIVAGAVVEVTKLDASEMKADIFIRDAVVAEAEVSRITGDDVGDELEEDEDSTGALSFNEPKKKKEKPREHEDMTGFESCKTDGPGTATGGQADQLEKWKADADRAQNDKAEKTMEAATSYFKKMPTKKELRELEKKKLNNVPQAAPKETVKLEEPKEGDEGDASKKAGGWFRAKAVVKGGVFQKGRAGGADGNSLKNRKQNVAAANSKGKGEDIGTISLARGKK